MISLAASSSDSTTVQSIDSESFPRLQKVEDFVIGKQIKNMPHFIKYTARDSRAGFETINF